MLEEAERDQSNSQKHENGDIDEHVVILYKESLGVFQEDSLESHSFRVEDPHAGDDNRKDEDNHQKGYFESLIGTEETRVQDTCQDANNDECPCSKHRSSHR